MKDNELATRYAKVLEHQSPQCREELVHMAAPLSAACTEPFFYSPQIALETRKTMIATVFQQALSDEALNFIFLMLKKKRFSLFPKTIEIYLARNRENLEVTMTTVVKMNPHIKDQWQQRLNCAFKQNVHIIEKINPRLLGGFILVVGNEMLDASLCDRLSHIKKDLLSCA